MRLISMSRVGRASRIAIIGTSVCPPAMTRAPSSLESSAQASSTSAAREYVNGAAFMDAYNPTERRRYCRFAAISLKSLAPLRNGKSARFGARRRLANLRHYQG